MLKCWNGREQKNCNEFQVQDLKNHSGVSGLGNWLTG